MAEKTLVGLCTGLYIYIFYIVVLVTKNTDQCHWLACDTNTKGDGMISPSPGEEEIRGEEVISIEEEV